MADTKISALPSVSSVGGTDEVAVNQSGTSKKATITQIENYLASTKHQDIGTKKPVRVATKIAGTLSTSFENGDTVDGIVLATGDRILIKNQSAGAENGIYTVNASGAPTRATDFDTDAEVVGGMLIPVLQGIENTNAVFMITNTGTITVGTTALTFKKLVSRGNLTKKTWNFPKYRRDEAFVSGGPVWTVTNGTINYSTSDNFLGTDSRGAEITTNSASLCTFETPVTYGLALTNRELYIAVKCSDWSLLTNLVVILSNDDSFANYWQLTITSMTKEFINGEWNIITMNPSGVGGGTLTVGAGSPTWTTFNRIRLRHTRSTGADVTVNWGGLYSIPKTTVGAISILFDDGFQGIYNLGLQTLKKYGLTASVMYIGDWLTDGTAGAMTKAQLKELEFNGWEICTHSAHVIVGSTEELSRILLQEERRKIEEAGFKSPDNFAYLGGNIDTNIAKAASDVFTFARKSNHKLANAIPPGDRRLINSWSYAAGDTISNLTTALGTVKTHGGWFVLSFHNVVSSGATGVDINQADLDTICSTIATELANSTVSLVNIGNMPDFIKKQLKS